MSRYVVTLDNGSQIDLSAVSPADAGERACRFVASHEGRTGVTWSSSVERSEFDSIESARFHAEMAKLGAVVVTSV